MHTKDIMILLVCFSLAISYVGVETSSMYFMNRFWKSLQNTIRDEFSNSIIKYYLFHFKQVI